MQKPEPIPVPYSLDAPPIFATSAVHAATVTACAFAVSARAIEANWSAESETINSRRQYLSRDVLAATAAQLPVSERVAFLRRLGDGIRADVETVLPDFIGFFARKRAEAPGRGRKAAGSQVTA